MESFPIVETPQPHRIASDPDIAGPKVKTCVAHKPDVSNPVHHHIAVRNLNHRLWRHNNWSRGHHHRGCNRHNWWPDVYPPGFHYAARHY